ncbi:MAG: glycosyl transferase [Sphaerochaeta sp.]|jgi:hypothetical protein|nr:glycosyl transferase [Sphaerochaeta sp.]
MKKTLKKAWYKLALNKPVIATRITYRAHFHRWPNFKKPRTFTEKLQWLKLFRYRHNALVTQCIDKYAVREYIKQLGCGELLNEVYGCWNSSSEIPWNELPEKFVLKCTHGSGMNIICNDKGKLDIHEASAQLDKWLKQQCGVNSVELLYEDIKPRIIAEKYIDTLDGNAPKDYKFFCSYGEPKFLFVASERSGDDAKFDFYTPEWEWLPVKNGHPNAGATEKPKRLEEMLSYARRLSKDFPLVRVDLYCEEDTIMFGELTFLHYGGLQPFVPDEFDTRFGDLFPFDSINRQ